MKTLVNKANPQIRITAPDGMVKNRTNCWAIWSEGNRLMLLDKDNWTLVEEEQDVNFKVKERKWVHDAVDNVFPEDGDFMSEFDFRKIIKDTARHFYELGRKGGSK